MRNLAWMDGTVCELSAAKVSLEDRGYFFGDGVYEVTRVYRGSPFYLSAHLERLQRSADAISLKLPYTHEELKNITMDLIKASGCLEGYVYMQLTRGAAPRDHLFPAGTEPFMCMYVRELSAYDPEKSLLPVQCVTLPDERWMNCDIKSLNLLANVLARQKAAQAGAAEAILYRPGGVVTEGTRSNVFALIDGKVRTHPCSNLILPGITRGIIIDIMVRLGIPFSEVAFSVEDLKGALEVWITSSGMEINPVGSIDGRPVGDQKAGSACRRIMAEFRSEVDQSCQKGGS